MKRSKKSIKRIGFALKHANLCSFNRFFYNALFINEMDDPLSHV